MKLKILLWVLVTGIVLLSGCLEKEIEWGKRDDKWIKKDVRCMKGEKPGYLCIDYCWEIDYEGYLNCPDKFYLDRTPNGTEVACLSQSCSIDPGTCHVICPI
ncbi:MAG: hypothetical protein KAU03_06425 [Candidatus Altiarchaeales archaeon]|nr:hypothetical protein [Candidatus Altiarchaeales archaeon]